MDELKRQALLLEQKVEVLEAEIVRVETNTFLHGNMFIACFFVLACVGISFKMMSSALGWF